MNLHFLQFPVQTGDPALDQSPVRLQLFLSGASGSDAAAQSGHGDTLSGQSSQTVAQLGQLHLKLTLAGGGMLGEDIQNHQRPVHDLQSQLLLQPPKLGRCQLVVADDAVGLQLCRQLPDLVNLAAADIGARMHGFPVLNHPAHSLGPGGVGQLRQLLQGFLHIFIFPCADADKDDALPGLLCIFK